MGRNRNLILSFIIFYLLSFNLYSKEQLDISPYIKAWRVDDHTQTLKFIESQAMFEDVTWQIEFNEKHLEVVRLAKEFIEKKPELRLSVRLMMYDIWVNRLLYNSVDISLKEEFIRLIPKVYQLKDKHLLSEVYILYASFNKNQPEFITYTTKALRIQEEIGTEFFPRYCGVLFGLSQALYHINYHKESIIYGEQNLNCLNNRNRNIDSTSYIYMLDLLGANYFKLKDYDKSYHYYTRLLNALENGDYNQNFIARWYGIANASIGAIFFEKNEINISIPYLKSSLDVALKHEIWNTAAESQKRLAQIDYDKGDYKIALSKWKDAYDWTSKHNNKSISMSVDLLKFNLLKKIADAYYKLNDIDSTAYYLEKSHREQLLYYKNITDRNYDLITANLNFEDTTNKLDITLENLQKEKLLRNGILSAVLLIGIILLLLIRQKQIRIKYQTNILLQEKMLADQQINEARRSIDVFKNNIAEKEELIEELIKNSNQSQEDLTHKFSKYIIITEEEWLKFKEDFSRAYPYFLPRIREIILSPTSAEERLACLVSLNLSNTQIAGILGISPESVARSKRRLKSRITLPDNILLEEYICNLHNS